MKVRLITLLTAFACTAATAQVTLTDAQIDSAFAKADVDNNGSVGLSEAKRFGLTVDTFRKADPDRHAALHKKEFAAAIGYQFAWANADRDGTLDWKEASMAGVRSKQTFDAVDPDHHGTIDLAGYLAALVAQAK